MGNMRDRRNTVPYTYPSDFVSRGALQQEVAPQKSGFGELAVLVLVIAGAAVALYLLGGTPHLPQEWPSWETVMFTLRGSYLPPELLTYVVSTLGWLLWAWMVSSLLLETLAVTAEAVSSGAAWAGTLRKVSGWIAMPVVRRAVDGTLGAVLLAHVLSRPPLEASAAGLSASGMEFAVPEVAPGVHHHVTPVLHDQRESDEQDGDQVVRYTVQPGDNLWDIAKRFYGTGEEWPRLMAANVGRPMTDGRIFPREGVIQPGWVLRVPLPSQVVEIAGAHTYYSVESGDTLYGIAARLLGDETRWSEIFALNRGVARTDDGRILIKPELIWPGLRLQLPLAPHAGSAEAAQPAASAVSPATAPVAQPPEPPEPAVTSAALPTTEIANPEETSATPAAANGAGAQPGRDHAGGALPLAAAAAATAVALGGAARFARWRFRRHPDGPPILDDGDDDVAFQHGFVVAEPARALTHRLHGQEAELALLAAEHLRVFLAQRRIRHVGLLTAGQGKRRLSLTLRAPLKERAELLDTMPAFRKLLGLRGDVRLTPDQDVLVEASWLKRAAFLTPPDGPPPNPPWLIPVGMLGDRQTLYLNWREVSNLLVAGSAGADVQTLMTSLLAALGARCQPPSLRLWVIADPQRLPPPLSKLPHLHGVVDPREEARVQVLLEEVRQTLLQRMVDEDELGLYRDPLLMGPPEPELLIVVGQVGEVAAHQAALEFIGRKGPAYGVRLLAGTTTPDALDDELVACFGTRVMLGLEDEQPSQRLMGTPDGVDLEGGQILVRIEGRDVVQARGFAIAPEHLEQVVGVMQQAYEQVPRGAGFSTPVQIAGDPVAERLNTIRPTRGAAEGVAEVSLGVDGGIPAEAESAMPDDAESCEGAPCAGAAGAVIFDRGVLPEGVTADGARCAEITAEPEFRTLTAADADDHGRSDAKVAVPVTLGANVPSTASPAAAVANGPSIEVPGGKQPLVYVQCFGGLRVTSHGQVLSPIGRDGKAQYKGWELLALLAAHPVEGVPKERVAELLWPDSDGDPQKSRGLSTVAVRLRGLLNEQVAGLAGKFIQVDRAGFCRWNPGQLTSDVQQFVALCQEADHLPRREAQPVLEQAQALYQGDLLHGAPYRWASEREESGLTLAERYQSQYLRVLRELAQTYLAAGEAVRAAALYRRILEREATDEAAVRGLYRCYQQLGDRTAVLREHRQLRQALATLFAGDDEAGEDADFEPEPEPETMAVYAEVMADLEARVRRTSPE